MNVCRVPFPTSNGDWRRLECWMTQISKSTIQLENAHSIEYLLDWTKHLLLFLSIVYFVYNLLGVVLYWCGSVFRALILIVDWICTAFPSASFFTVFVFCCAVWKLWNIQKLKFNPKSFSEASPLTTFHSKFSLKFGPIFFFCVSSFMHYSRFVQKPRNQNKDRQRTIYAIFPLNRAFG